MNPIYKAKDGSEHASSEAAERRNDALVAIDEMEPVSRTMRIDLRLPEDRSDSYQRVLSSIRQYRATLRHCFGVFAAAQAAGATFKWDEDEFSVKPLNAVSRQILALSTGKDGKALGYQLRDHVMQDLCPTWMSFVWDSLRRDLEVSWKAKDPEFTNVQRGWLTLQGTRGLAQFNRRGIGFPVASARPKFDKHILTLKWDHDIGPIAFQIGRLDAGRWHLLRSILRGDEGWSLGTIYLSENDGKLFALVTHQRPATVQSVDMNRVMRVRFQETGDTLCTIAGPDGEQTFVAIDSAGVVDFLRQHDTRRAELERRRGAHGSPSRPWGHRRGWLATQNVLDRVTLIRTRVVSQYNHSWTRRIISLAIKWRCGTIEVQPLPKTIHGHSWQWSDLDSKLTYKATENGIAVVVLENATV